MRRGWRTSEYWLAVQWLGLSAWAVHRVLCSPPSTWPAAFVALPAIVVLVWLAGAVVNNYSENRFLLKRGGEDAEEGGVPPEPGVFGFGRHVASWSPEQE